MSAAASEEDEIQEDYEVDSTYASPVAKVIVGSPAQVFFMHKNRLTEASEFFRACLSTGMIEQRKNKIILSEDPCRAFKFVVEWIYKHEILEPNHNDDAMSALQAWILPTSIACQISKMLLWTTPERSGATSTCVLDSCHYLPENTQDTIPLQQHVLDQLSHDLANCPSCQYRSEHGMGCHGESTQDLLASTEISARRFWAANNLERDNTLPSDLEGCHYNVDKEGDICQKKED
ncbi:uncharacterized protein Z519_10002 [Cladophialophora bantiana CBS 173.52]|uniref:BTB domain-containing protein n=1 Tax=Cladophialophora bantiana (strain ATCC 10958 / CBS 173.52 / CDC B-1940 / NIH 8579) TaxID=1442370 RepID=A0A0D2HEA1_CLAB1|nr:uncharacterized protein Z519_10002 [Cladophialophora bantiana CBS 173.52]KIW89150.1 hypothetical protein Z519_10002 [Cladophialophora bantiana CBS 173.52]